jgi:hypothetical protein
MKDNRRNEQVKNGDGSTTDYHESYGVALFSRRTGGAYNLFGSSIKHGQTIALTISRASKKRDLHQDWIHGEEELIEVLMSPNQFAQMITSMNVGSGVPCTIQYVMAKRMEECPSVEMREQFVDEFKKDVRKVMKDADTIVAEVTEMFKNKQNITKSDRADILAKIGQIMQHVKSNMPFVHSQFNEAMDDTVTEAKAEVEAFVSNKITSLGIEALNEEVQKAISASKDSKALQIEKKQ